MKHAPTPRSNRAPPTPTPIPTPRLVALVRLPDDELEAGCEGVELALVDVPDDVGDGVELVAGEEVEEAVALGVGYVPASSMTVRV